MTKYGKRKYYSRLAKAVSLLLFLVLSLSLTEIIFLLAVQEGRKTAAEEENRVRVYAVSFFEKVVAPAYEKELLLEQLKTAEAEGVCAGGGVIMSNGDRKIFGLRPPKLPKTGRELAFHDWKIHENDIPFKGRERILIRKFIAPETGKAALQGLFNEEIRIGEIYLIFDKSRVYAKLGVMLKNLKRNWLIGLCAAACLSVAAGFAVGQKGRRKAHREMLTPVQEPLYGLHYGKIKTSLKKHRIADGELNVTDAVPEPIVYSEANTDYITLDISSIHEASAEGENIRKGDDIKNAVLVRQRIN